MSCSQLLRLFSLQIVHISIPMQIVHISIPMNHHPAEFDLSLTGTNPPIISRLS